MNSLSVALGTRLLLLLRDEVLQRRRFAPEHLQIVFLADVGEGSVSSVSHHAFVFVFVFSLSLTVSVTLVCARFFWHARLSLTITITVLALLLLLLPRSQALHPPTTAAEQIRLTTGPLPWSFFHLILTCPALRCTPQRRTSRSGSSRFTHYCRASNSLLLLRRALLFL